MQESRKFSEVAGSWRSIRRLLPVYAQLAEEFHLADPPVKDFRDLRGTDQAAIDSVVNWMDMIDAHAEAHHFRQVMQSSAVDAPEDKLAALIHRFQGKTDERDRDKLDFCLTQYLAVCAPPLLYQVEPSLDDVARVLQPVLGDGKVELPEWLQPLDELIQEMRGCQSLRHFEEKKIIEKGRELKKMTRGRETSNSTLAIFTRFNFLLRQNTFRLLQADIQSVEKLLDRMEEWQVETLDCTSLGLSAEESLSSLRQLCENWKRPSVTEYTQFQFGRLLQLHAVLDRAYGSSEGIAEVRIRKLTRQVELVRAEMDELRNAMVAMQSRLECAESAISVSSTESPEHARAMWREEKSAWVDTIGCVQQGSARPAELPPTPPRAPKPEPEPETSYSHDLPDLAAFDPPIAGGNGHSAAMPADILEEHEAHLAPESHEQMPDDVLIEAIAEILPQVRAAKLRNRQLPAVQVAGTSLLLTAPEMGALIDPSMDTDGLRGLVGAKIFLITAMQQRNAGLLERALKLATTELHRDEKIERRHRHTPEVAEAWATAIKQLRFIMQRAKEAGRVAAGN
jgi:hypothetical protein